MSVYRRKTGRVCKVRYICTQLVTELERRKLQLRFAFVVMREILTLGSAPSARRGEQDMVGVNLQQDERKDIKQSLLSCPTLDSFLPMSAFMVSFSSFHG